MILAITDKQKDFIISLDHEAKEILQNGGGQESLLISLSNRIFEIKGIMDSSTHTELDYYCSKYEGFYYYMKLMEQLAQGCADGAFDDIMKK